ncbi:uncharacterized protein LOC121412051 [Lytechinus variegatus]|uniref:uncharacterized protein LOC121412051 n=1 Tax=Lytechinus variegatus TaxID=7654 RepID=UPI001BB1CD09|nr:uncharacterized protein LOC121412051 [Lytechinus variegatus]
MGMVILELTLSYYFGEKKKNRNENNQHLFLSSLCISDSTACKCRTGNQKCWTKCARIYQSKRRAESPRSEQTLPDILKQSSEIDDIIYEDIVDNNQMNSADSPNLEELLDSLPFPWRRNIYRLIQKAEMAELENFL